MKTIQFRLPQSKADLKQLWKEHTSKRYKKNVEAMRQMTEFYIGNTLRGRWGEIAKGNMVNWTESDKKQFSEEMRAKMREYINRLMV